MAAFMCVENAVEESYVAGPDTGDYPALTLDCGILPE